MRIHSLQLGHMKNLVYVLIDEATNKAAVVDPAWDVPAIINLLNEHDAQLELILLTHCHFDHIEGLESLLLHKSVPVYLSSKELLQDYPKGLALTFLDDGDSVQLGETLFQVTHTPGHSVGSLCYYAAPHLITGDTLFVEGCGRCDLSGSDVNSMYDSLNWIKSLPDDTIIYPGHDYGKTRTASLGDLKQSNRFLKCPDKDSFIKERMG